MPRSPIQRASEGRAQRDFTFGTTHCKDRRGFRQIDGPQTSLRENEPDSTMRTDAERRALMRRHALSHDNLIFRGGHRGSGNHWVFDGGAMVQNSIRLGKPVIVVTFK